MLCNTSAPLWPHESTHSNSDPVTMPFKKQGLCCGAWYFSSKTQHVYTCFLISSGLGSDFVPVWSSCLFCNPEWWTAFELNKNLVSFYDPVSMLGQWRPLVHHIIVTFICPTGPHRGPPGPTGAHRGPPLQLLFEPATNPGTPTCIQGGSGARHMVHDT